jgi:predicted nucleic acid-binding protein
MPEVISNTTPLQYLHQLGCLDFLSQLYQQVIVPQSVVDELRQGELQGFDVPSPSALAWVRVETVAPLHLLRVAGGLGSGERETIALALAKTDPLLILDDAAARTYAQNLRIRFTGTLGVLLKAKQSGLITAIRPYLDQLDKLGFFLGAHVRAKILSLAGESP